MTGLEVAKTFYDALNRGDAPALLELVHPEVRWQESPGFKFGGLYNDPQAVLQGVLVPLTEAFQTIQVDVERFIDGGDVVVMQGHYVGTTRKTGRSVRAMVAHILEVREGHVVRFDQYVDSATINAVL